MDDLELERGHESDSPAPESGNGKKGGDEVVTLSKKEWQAHQARLKEVEESERYWSSKARKDEPAADEPDDEPDDEDDDEPEITDDDPEKFTDDLSAKGIDALVKRGVLTKKAAKEMISRLVSRQVDSIVTKRIGQVQKGMLEDAKLIQKYPDLNDPKSELHKITAAKYKEMVAEDKSIPKSTALRLAAKEASLELRERGGDRQERIRRQGGQADTRGSRGYEIDDEDDLGPQARELVSAFSRYGVDEESMKKFRRGDR